MSHTGSLVRTAVGRRASSTVRSAMALCTAYACSGASPSDADRVTAMPDGGHLAAVSIDAAVPEQRCELVLRSGHGDLYIGYAPAVGPSLHVRAEFDPGTSEALYEPERVCIEVPRQTYEWAVEFGGRPAAEIWAFLGLETGQPFWFLPQVARTGAPWFGIAADSVPAPAVVRSWQLLLSALEAPRGGELSLWVSDPFGNPSPLLSTVNGLVQTEVRSGSHAHFNWGFTRAGTYQAVFEVRALEDPSATPAQATFRFEVVP